MTTTINASTSSGLVQTADTSGILQLQTANTAAMTLDGSQNVGVGTTSPQQRLHVYQPTANTDAATVQIGSASAYTGFLNLRVGTSGAGTFIGGLYTPDGSLASLQGTYGLTFSTSGSNLERMRIDSSGNVSIGSTNTTGTRFRVYGSTTGVLPANTGSTASALARITDNSNVAIDFGIDPSAPYGAVIQVHDSTAQGTNYPLNLQINGGNVGIGTKSPSSNLHISGSTYPTLRIDGGASYGGILQFKGNDGVENAYLLSYGTGSGSQSNCIIFGTNTATNSGAVERMRINQYGNIALQGGTVNAGGIGITFPATQSASSDANCLDDYEEGTFTPTIVGLVSGNASYTGQIGKYTKIGNTVHVQIDFYFTKNTLSGQLQVQGLPFTNGSGQNCRGIPYDWYSAGGTAFVNALAIFPAGTTNLNLYAITGANLDGTGRTWQGSDLGGASCEMHFCFTYFA